MPPTTDRPRLGTPPARTVIRLLLLAGGRPQAVAELYRDLLREPGPAQTERDGDNHYAYREQMARALFEGYRQQHLASRATELPTQPGVGSVDERLALSVAFHRFLAGCLSFLEQRIVRSVDRPPSR